MLILLYLYLNYFNYTLITSLNSFYIELNNLIKKKEKKKKKNVCSWDRMDRTTAHFWSLL